MSRRRSLLWIFALVPAAAGTPAFGQDVLDPILKSGTISARQRATMEAELSQRIKRLIESGTNEARRVEARDRLVRPAQAKGVSKAGLDAYSEICAKELEPVIASQISDVGLDALLFLSALDNPFTAPAYRAALESPHAAIRLMSARGIQSLQKKLADQQSECEDVLAALGRAGAAERNEHVLRVIYHAVNFPAAVPKFKYADAAAAALNAILASRLQQLSAGSRDEKRDVPGWAAADACYSGASDEQKTLLMRNMAGMLQIVVDRYFDPHTGEEAYPALADAADRIEKVIHDFIKASKVSPPANRVSARLKGRISDRNKAHSEVQADLKALMAVLQKDPWNLS
jgi:hypothetical protein